MSISFTENTEIDNLTSFEEIKECYEKLCLEEDEVGKELEALLQQQMHLESKMTAFHKMLPNLQLVFTDTQQLSSMISFTSTLAENVSSKVRQLDLAKSHVSESMQRVEDILDLKFCTDGVKTALQNEDYEQAAVHIHRFLSLDENLLKHTAQNITEGSSLDTAFTLLHEAESKIKAIVTKKFDEAVRDEDIASVERFFKIFPLLSQHEEGLRKFSKYLCSQIADTAQKNLKLALATSHADPRANVIFADTITLLFEGIARVIEIHQPLIETYYGPGHLMSVIEILQQECDRQSRRIIEEFKKHRQFLPTAQQIQQLQYRSNRNMEKLDPRELDVLLAEVTLLNTRSELYIRFIRRRISNDIEVANQDETKKAKQLEKMTAILKECSLSRLMQELLGHYIMMEEYFMKESVMKAVHMDTLEEGSLTSSMVDDVFFIVKKCIRRALSSSSVDGVCALMNNSCTLLEADFLEVLQSQLNVGFPSGSLDFSQAYTVIHSSIQQGKLSASEPEKMRISYLVTLNNSEVAMEYIQTLKKTVEEEVERQMTNTTDQEKAKLETCISGLSNVSNKFKELLDNGMKQLIASILKPRIKPWIEAFISVPHEITEDEFANYEANDPFIQNFIINLDSLLNSFKVSLTSTNYDSMVSIVTADITSQLEKAVMKSSFNRLGGLQFDKELRALVNYLTNVTTWTIRDKFARLTQMSTVLNLDRVNEILDYWGPNSGPLTWRLTPSEVRQVLSLRTDFRTEEIKRLKL